MLSPLKLKRLEKGLSQHALGFLAKVPQVRICYAEKGYPALKEEQKKKIASALKCKVSDIFPRED